MRSPKDLNDHRKAPPGGNALKRAQQERAARGLGMPSPPAGIGRSKSSAEKNPQPKKS